MKPLLTVTGNHLKNTHTQIHTCTRCYQFFYSPMREWEEVEKEGSDKERGRERERGGRECVCERERDSVPEKERERGGWKELYGAMIFSPPGCCLSSSWLCHSIVRSPCVPRSRHRYSDQHSAKEPGMNQPQQRAFEMAVCASAWREERIRLSQASGSLQCALA